MYIVTPVMYFVSCVTIKCAVEAEKTQLGNNARLVELDGLK